MRTFTHDALTFDVIDTGPQDGSVAILLHGFPQSADAWSAVVPHLTGAGLRVLAPDQRGYSPGARPSGRRSYRMSLLTADVLALADAAGARAFHLVGHDWGGRGVGSRRSPARTCDQPHHPLGAPSPRGSSDRWLRSSQLLRSWYMFLFQIPGLERLVVRRDGALLKRFLAGSGMPEAHARLAFERMIQPGAFGAALNWYRGVPLERQPRSVRFPSRRRTCGAPGMWRSRGPAPS